jgi:hypothetical protein
MASRNKTNDERIDERSKAFVRAMVASISSDIDIGNEATVIHHLTTHGFGFDESCLLLDDVIDAVRLARALDTALTFVSFIFCAVAIYAIAIATPVGFLARG